MHSLCVISKRSRCAGNRGIPHPFPVREETAPLTKGALRERAWAMRRNPSNDSVECAHHPRLLIARPRFLAGSGSGGADAQRCQSSAAFLEGRRAGSPSSSGNTFCEAVQRGARSPCCVSRSSLPPRFLPARQPAQASYFLALFLREFFAAGLPAEFPKLHSA